MRLLLIPIVLAVLLLIFAAVGISGSFDLAPSASTAGGVYRSADGGRTFELRSDVPDDEEISLDRGVVELKQVGQNTFFAATASQGIFKSTNGASSWELIFTGEVETTSFGVNPNDTNEVYAGAVFGNRARIYKTVEGNANWTEIYVSADTGTEIVSISVSQDNPEEVYALVSNGVLLKSFNKGQDWVLGSDLKTLAVDLTVDPRDSDTVYVATEGSLYRSTDGGFSFEQLRPQLRSSAFTGAQLTSFAINPNDSNELYVGSIGQMVRSRDGGETWEEINILTPDARVGVRAIEVNPQNGNIVHYTAGSIFYTSRNRGESWNTAALSTSGIVREILIDSRNNDIIYIGVN